MLTIKKTHFFSLLFAFVLIFGFMVFNTFSTEEKDWSNITFSSSRNVMNFFDHSTGKIYLYTEFEGKLEKVWILDELGEDLRRLK